MNEFAVDQIVQFLANIGVILGIVFLAYEIRQNSAQLRSQSRFNYYQTRIGLTSELAAAEALTTFPASDFTKFMQERIVASSAP